VRVTPDGQRVMFLRSESGTDPVNSLWQLDVASGAETLVADARSMLGSRPENLTPAERARRERQREATSGIVSYATDADASVAVFALSGRLFRAPLTGGEVAEVAVAGPVADPRPSPDGREVAYVAGDALHVVSAGGHDRVLAAEDGVTWGLAEFVAAEEMGRFRGYWWAPDSAGLLAARVDESPVQRWYIADPANPAQPPAEVAYPAAGTANADVWLAYLPLDGARVDVVWDRAEYPYLTAVHWSDNGPPLIVVMARDQRSLQVLTVNPASGETGVLRSDTDEAWLEVVPGVPAWGPEARLVWTVDADGSRRLVVDGAVVTPATMHVREVLAVTDRGVVVSVSSDDPAQVLAYLVTWDRDIVPLTDAGVTSVAVGGDTTVRMSADLEHFGTSFSVNGHSLVSHAQEPPLTPAVSLLWVAERRLRAGLVLPAGHVAGTKLPVLMDPYGGPHHQEVVAACNVWLEPQWLADQGFAVVVADGRGTPGRGTEWERAIAGDLLSAALEDQVDALHAVADGHPDLDLSRVGIRGWSFGGYLAAAAVLRRPDVFHAAIAGAPVVDMALYDTFYTERYLGTDLEAESYRRSSLLADVSGLTGQLLLIHGLADDNVVVAHSLRLSSALLAAGKPHTVLPLSGVTHMATEEEVAENLLLLQVDFLRRALG